MSGKRRPGKASTAQPPAATAPSKPRPQRPPLWQYWPVAVVVVGVILRAIYMAQFSQTLFAHDLFLDSRLYDTWANCIRSGKPFDHNRPFFIEPGYAYFLAAVKMMHGSYPLVRILQSILGIGTAVLTGVMARRLAGDKAALAAGLLAASYLPLIFFDAMELKTTMEVFMIVLAVALAPYAIDRPTWPVALGYGLLVGSFALVRANILAVIFVIAVYSAWKLRDQRLLLLSRERAEVRSDQTPLAPLSLEGRGVGGERSNPTWVVFPALFLLGAMVTPLGMGIRNVRVAGAFVPLPTSSGLNLYVGNSHESNGYSPDASFERADPMFEEDDSINEAARRLNHAVSPQETSRYWWGQTWREAAQDPGHFVRLLFTKIGLYFDYYEITDNLSMYFMQGYVPMLNWPLPGYWLAVPLGFGGMAYAVARRKSEGMLLTMVILFQAAGVIVFHIADRYRLAGVPLLLALGVSALVEIWQAEATRQGGAGRGARSGSSSPTADRPGMRQGLVPLGVGMLAGAILVALPSKGQDMSAQRNMYAVAAAGAGNGDLAIAGFQQAIAIDPNSAQSYCNLALALFTYRKDDAGAEANLRKAVGLKPQYGDAWSDLGRVVQDEGRFAEAGDDFRKAAEDGFAPAQSYFSAAAAYGNVQQYDQAEQMLDEGFKTDPNNADGQKLLGNICFVRHDIAGARRAWQASLRADPNNPALVQTLASLDKR